jgi:hypothetical protein
VVMEKPRRTRRDCMNDETPHSIEIAHWGAPKIESKESGNRPLPQIAAAIAAPAAVQHSCFLAKPIELRRAVRVARFGCMEIPRGTAAAGSRALSRARYTCEHKS